MPLNTGSKLGPYEILAPLGAGGMGEVYRARDTRLGREVALKILPTEVAGDPSRRQRFELEARAVAALNHPNIVAVYDVGDNYIVSELIQGEPLRGASFGLRKTLDVAAQIADGLAAAHEAGIVHRDLKPENILVTRDGRVKILDFGIAKLASGPAAATTETQTVRTEPGLVMGTIGYMSPEQVRGLDADHRSDIFSFGLILHELLSGKRAFQGETSVETMAAILKQDAPELPESVPMSVRQIVTHCLEKDPVNRFQSARDLKFALAQAGTLSGTSPVMVQARPRRLIGIWAGAFVLVLVAATAAAYWVGANRPRPSMTTHPLTFRRGRIQAARFAPDGRTVIYAAAWEGGNTELYSVRPEFPESLPLNLNKTGLLAISRTGEMAVLAPLRFQSVFTFIGSLARLPLAGGAPRAVMEDITAADWSPDGSTLAVVRDAPGRARLEFPPGKVLYETAGWISHPRVSPKGDRIAFLEHPQRFDDRGVVAVVDLSGKKQVLASGWESEQGLAWSPSGNEVWFSATEEGFDLALWAVSLSGRQRLLARNPGGLKLQDVFPDGRILLTLSHTSGGMLVGDGKGRDRDLSLFDSAPVDFTPDGKSILFFEGGANTGSNYAVCFRGVDGSPAAKLGEGHAQALSPDGRWALTIVMSSPPQLVMLPTGVGDLRKLPRGSIDSYQSADWLPDGKSVVFTGNESGKGTRLYVQSIDGGMPRPISGEGVDFPFYSHPVAPDGKSVLARDADSRWKRFPIEGGAPQTLPNIQPDEDVIRWNKDGRSLFVNVRGAIPARILLVDLATGRRSLWKEIVPADPAGLVSIDGEQIAPDGKTYAYGYLRMLDDLYIAEGLK